MSNIPARDNQCVPVAADILIDLCGKVSGNFPEGNETRELLMLCVARMEVDTREIVLLRDLINMVGDLIENRLIAISDGDDDQEYGESDD